MPEDLPFNEEQFIIDRDAAMYTYQVEYNMATNENLMVALGNYYQVLWETGQNLNAGFPADEVRSKWAAEELIDEFNAMRMLDIPAKWLRDNARYYSNDLHSWYQNALDEAADEARHHKALWSKTDTKWALEEAMRRGLNILEGTGAAGPQNKKNNGVKSWSDALVTGYLWTGMSTGFVRGALSTVEGFVLEGKTKGSVMANHEVPNLGEMIRQGLVKELHVQIENIDDPSKPPERWTLVAGRTFHVHSQASFEQIPSPAAGFPERQQIWYEKENRKASIDDFVRAVGDKNVAILLPRRDAIVPSDVEGLVKIQKYERDRLAGEDHWHLRRASILKNKKETSKKDIYKNKKYQKVLSASLGGKLEFMQALGDSYKPHGYEPRSKSVSAALGSTDQAYYAASGSTDQTHYAASGRANSAPSGSTDQAHHVASGAERWMWPDNSTGLSDFRFPEGGADSVDHAMQRLSLNRQETDTIPPEQQPTSRGFDLSNVRFSSYPALDHQGSGMSASELLPSGSTGQRGNSSSENSPNDVRRESTKSRRKGKPRG